MAPTYHVIRLPRFLESIDLRADSHTQHPAKTFRELRLYALKTAPEAFASSHEVEKERGLDHTVQRLCNPKATHFIALKTAEGVAVDPEPSADNCRLIMEAEWVGMIVLVGPQEDDGSVVSASDNPWEKMTSASPPTQRTPGPESDFLRVLHYHVNGVFVDPSARGSGLGRRLMEAALDEAREKAVSGKAGLLVTVIVNEENGSARKLYERAWFKVVREETYVQQPRELMGENELTEKVALSMELREPMEGAPVAFCSVNAQ